MYKTLSSKIAIATLVIAPVTAEVASRFTARPAASETVVQPAPAAVPVVAARSNAIHYSAITQAGSPMAASTAPAGPFNPAPTLDPDAAAAKAMTQGSPAPQAASGGAAAAPTPPIHIETESRDGPVAEFQPTPVPPHPAQVFN